MGEPVLAAGRQEEVGGLEEAGGPEEAGRPEEAEPAARGPEELEGSGEPAAALSSLSDC